VLCFFFFQAEDGIRDDLVTGVQTCALPISVLTRSSARRASSSPASRFVVGGSITRPLTVIGFCRSLAMTPQPPLSDRDSLGRARSEERRVGKECRSRWWRR